MTLREKVKGVEFAAEKMQEETLESLVGHVSPTDLPLDRQIDCMSGNLRRYCADKGIQLDSWAVDRLATIASAAIRAPDTRLIEAALGKPGSD